MAHLLAFRRGESRDVGHDGLGHMFGSPLGSVLFGAATDFADHDNGFGGFIVLKGFQSLLQGRADDRIAARAKACGETDVRQLPIS